MNGKPDIFRVTDGKREGICYSYYDYLVINWDDGEQQTTLELSLKGIRKTVIPPPPPPPPPYKKTMKNFIELRKHHDNEQVLIKISSIKKVEPGYYSNRGTYIYLDDKSCINVIESYDEIKRMINENTNSA